MEGTRDRDFFNGYLDAWNAHDPAAVARYMADDAIYEDVALGRVLHGPSEIAAFVEEATRALSDFRFEEVSLFTAGSNYANEWIMIGTNDREVQGVPASGRSFRVRGRRLASSMRAGGLPRIGTTTTWPRCSRSLASSRPPRRSFRRHVGAEGTPVGKEDIVKPSKAFIKKHPVLTYYALVFAISWGGILTLVAPGGIPGEPEDVARLFPFTLAALFAGPSVAGVVMTALVSGRAGLRELLARLGRWRVGAAWWAAALLTGPVLVAAVLFGLSLYSPDFVPGLLTTEDKLGLLIFGLGWGLVGGGLLEELGWTGFAVPTLRRRYTALATGLIVGVLWGTWHVLIAVWASRGLAGDASLTGFIAGFLAFYFVALPAYRVLMVWLYDHTASLLLAMLMHAVLSASTIVLQPVSVHGQFTWNVLLGAALWAVVAVVARVKRGELSRRPVQPAVGHAS
jgi:steroid delta-isomerase-like uncharacterized protein